MDFSALLIKMFILVVMLVIGYACARTGLAGSEFVKAANKLVLNVFLTATILNSVLSSELILTGMELMNVMLVLSVSIVLCYLAGFVSGLFVPDGENRKPVFELLIGVMNTMFFALPVISEVYGSDAVFYCSLSCVPFNVLLYTYGAYRLKSGVGKSRIRIKDIISVPLIATFAALVIFILKIPMPRMITELAGTLSGVTMPMSMIVVGASLGSVSFLDAFKQWRLYVMSLIRLIMCPLAVWLLCGLLTADDVLRGTAMLIAAAPSAVLVSVLSIQYGRDEVYASEGILLSTLLSVVTIPTLIYVLL